MPRIGVVIKGKGDLLALLNKENRQSINRQVLANVLARGELPEILAP